MSLILQWLIIPPLVLGFFVTWKSQVALLDDAGGTEQRSTFSRVVATFGAFEWASLLLATTYFVFLVVKTIGAVA